MPSIKPIQDTDLKLQIIDPKLKVIIQKAHAISRKSATHRPKKFKLSIKRIQVISQKLHVMDQKIASKRNKKWKASTKKQVIDKKYVARQFFPDLYRKHFVAHLKTTICFVAHIPGFR